MPLLKAEPIVYPEDLLGQPDTLPAEPGSKYSRVAIRTAFTAEYRVIVAFLSSVETARPALFVDRLELRGSDDTKSDPAHPVLTATLDIYGLRPVR